MRSNGDIAKVTAGSVKKVGHHLTIYGLATYGWTDGKETGDQD